MAETNFQRENCLVVLAEFIRDRRVSSARAIRQREEKKETKERERERESGTTENEGREGREGRAVN